MQIKPNRDEPQGVRNVVTTLGKEVVLTGPSAP